MARTLLPWREAFSSPAAADIFTLKRVDYYLYTASWQVKNLRPTPAVLESVQTKLQHAANLLATLTK